MELFQSQWLKGGSILEIALNSIDDQITPPFYPQISPAYVFLANLLILIAKH